MVARSAVVGVRAIAVGMCRRRALEPIDAIPGLSEEALTVSNRLSGAELQDRAVRGAIWTIIGIAVSMPLAFVVNIFVARALEASNYGRLAYLTTVITVIDGIISLGVGTALVQFGAKGHAAGRTDEVKRLLSATQGFRLLVAAPILSVVVAVIADVSIPLKVVAILFGILLPATVEGGLACMAIENKTASEARNGILVNVLTQAAALVAVFTFRTADSIWVARLIAGGIGTATAMFFISPTYRRAILRPRLPRNFPPGFWRFGLPAGAAGVIGTFLVSRTEVVILTWMNAAEAAGVFALAFGLSGQLFSPAQALVSPLIPAVSGLREVDEGAVSRALTRTLRANSTAVAFLAGGALPALAALVPLIYGSSFGQVPEVLMVLGIAGSFLVIAGPVQAFVQARLLGARLLWINLGALVLDLVLAVALVPLIGVWGAVTANVVAALTRLGLLLIGEVRSLGLTWMIIARCITPTVLGGVACVLSWSVTRVLELRPISAGVCAGLVGTALVTVGIWVTRSGLTEGDARAIKRVMPTSMQRLIGPGLRIITHVRDVDSQQPQA